MQVSVTDNADQTTSESVIVSATAMATTETLQVTLVFNKPNGNALANTSIYYGTSEGQETTLLGKTDSEGKIISTNSSLVNKTLYFKSADGKYTASAFIPLSDGPVDLLLTEVTSESVGEGDSVVPYLVVLAVAAVAAAGGIIVMKKVRGKNRPSPST